MALNIRNDQTEKLAADLAALTGETKTEAVTIALRDRLDRVRRQKRKRSLADEIGEIALHFSSLPRLDSRTTKEIQDDLYDEHGLPK